MLNEGVGSWTARRARKSPDAVAVIHDGASLSYSELHDRVTRLACALRGLGVRRGDRVGYFGPNHPAYLESMFATWAAGAVFVPLNARLAGPELAHQLADAGTAVLFCGGPQAGLAAAAAREAGVRHLISAGTAGSTGPVGTAGSAGPAGTAGSAGPAGTAGSAGPAGTAGTAGSTGPASTGGAGDGALAYEDLLAGGAAQWSDEPVSLDDPCLIMYTSGTTGRAKGATLTHGNITWNAFNVLVDTDLAGDAVALVVAPLFHTAALNMLCLPVLLKGGTVVIEAAFDPGRALDLIERHRVSVMFGVPAIYDAIAAQPRWPDADLSSLRALLCGGAPVPLATIRTYLDRGLSFIQGYGMTEAAPGVLLLDAAHAQSKAGSAGLPHFFTDVRIVGPGLADVGAGERGEIVVAGPNVMLGYWNQPQATQQAIAGGTWLRSGDVAVRDEDGYVTVADRVKDVIISGGENVYPAEVESALRDHPAVADCGVIGVPDQRWGETGRAVVVLRPGAQATERDILDFLDGRIARYKIPKSVRFAAELPRTATGKILKKTLRDGYGD